MCGLWLALIICAAGAPNPPGALGRQVAEFELRDPRGAAHRLNEWAEYPVVVVVFLGVDCPLAKLYAGRIGELQREFGPRGVRFVGVNSNQHDSADDVARFARAHRLDFPVFKDPGSRVADLLGARRTPEALVLDRERRVRYQGRIDDQYVVGSRRSEPGRRDLACALEDLLQARPVRRPHQPATGCLIDRPEGKSDNAAVTYCRDVAPLLQRRCLACHRPGQMAPFPLTSYGDAAGWAGTIREVVDERRMPPWHADPRYGSFANDARLSDQERQVIDAWVAAGAPEGDPADLGPPPAFADGWNIPRPDDVFTIPQRFEVPAQGVVDYQTFEVDPGFAEDRWVKAAEIRPGNRQVVHHCSVFLKPPGYSEPRAQGELGSYFLAGTAVGTPPLTLPAGMAKRIPAGWRLVFVIHYQTVGTAQVDQTGIGLVYADPATVRQEVATNLIVDEELRIPPGAADYRVEKAKSFPKDVLLIALFPHMHLRGKSFRYEATYPNGATEVLLSVPRWDFNWQNRYVLAEPKRLPAGTVLRCIATYDNSADNPHNPDPSVTVRAGQQSTDEMFNGYVEIALADQDLTRPLTWDRRLAAGLGVIGRPAIALTLLVALGGWVMSRRLKRPAWKTDGGT